MAERPTQNPGAGGTKGASRPPYARITSVRRGRLRFSPVNDNREPPERRMIRAALAVGCVLVIGAALLGAFFG